MFLISSAPWLLFSLKASSFAVATYVGISAGGVGALILLVVVLIIAVHMRRRVPKPKVPLYLTLRRQQVMAETRSGMEKW